MSLWVLLVYIVNALNNLQEENELYHPNLEYRSILIFYEQLFKTTESAFFRESITNSIKYMHKIFNNELNKFFDGGCYEVYKEKCFE
uniref:Uncharacterized protein n=1 Tax=Meloidogyne enterolobii TaxID=390850 RepID=A0A6V7TIQ2_MELEN|nr:unnamed protein product [Meloidogyne enterolobii]